MLAATIGLIFSQNSLKRPLELTHGAKSRGRANITNSVVYRCLYEGTDIIGKATYAPKKE